MLARVVRQGEVIGFELTLSAKSDEEFNAKWDSAVKNLKSIVDVDTMLSRMTEIARKVATD